MRRCIVHVGFPKTGTTSIQSSLLHGLRDPRFRFLTLDSDFGNFLVASAFRVNFGDGRQLFSRGMDRTRAEAATVRSRRYLDRSLAVAARDGCTPILSAEAIINFKDESALRLRDFLAERGWSPQVVAYVRPPIDLLASLFGQALRADLPFAAIPELIAFRDRFEPVGMVRRLDRTFGAGSVSLHRFEPADFPDRCVVRHFCGAMGIDFRGEDVIRENDSLNLAQIQFLYAMLRADRGHGMGVLRRLRRRILVERLSGLPGPPLRLHRSLTDPMVERLRPEWDWLESRLGRSLPMSSRPADRGEGDRGEGIRSEADLLDFPKESLDWLARQVGRPAVGAGRGTETERETIEQLRRLDVARSPGVVVGLVRTVRRERWERAVRKFRNQR